MIGFIREIYPNIKKNKIFKDSYFWRNLKTKKPILKIPSPGECYILIEWLRLYFNRRKRNSQNHAIHMGEAASIKVVLRYARLQSELKNKL